MQMNHFAKKNECHSMGNTGLDTNRTKPRQQHMRSFCYSNFTQWMMFHEYN